MSAVVRTVAPAASPSAVAQLTPKSLLPQIQEKLVLLDFSQSGLLAVAWRDRRAGGGGVSFEILVSLRVISTPTCQDLPERAAGLSRTTTEGEAATAGTAAAES
ncbi:hypothetical protein GCM10023170_018830 [Phytohabitans houttuyneae]|uniref:Uncharacterized protein n=2 Tax=Phytohabitans houttuyneae TaxID=1076126 RepID=A0A6V8JU45_9ACTN|nr:hypothetical protein Phou_002730 [Phytohabitans houttuyneae]